MMLKKEKKEKKAMAREVLGWWILGLFGLAIIIGAIIIFKNKSFSVVDFIKNLFKFG